MLGVLLLDTSYCTSKAGNPRTPAGNPLISLRDERYPTQQKHPDRHTFTSSWLFDPRRHPLRSLFEIHAEVTLLTSIRTESSSLGIPERAIFFMTRHGYPYAAIPEPNTSKLAQSGDAVPMCPNSVAVQGEWVETFSHKAGREIMTPPAHLS
ncbi:hypothetical protein GE21DRAFT_345 [Neurospora crassa]|uniref:Uncharacterized protein n=1 Tax=Neurospora crassa (strain ATCC 24698 / 74-OR23-1A / CBS 708.71 / DSM 1257 / FGSC 987) TaxID=367110 RepID=V5IQJ5_NEUCR|nr:hypothetical protein NCU16334 [Neurospora crassa OR74A]ESA43819.1 hypothetical protein NCU16334 [Neurospora crassa OR74A]KHE89054.1 hypothetical protein GE21DRAFT_345 [Neurospora crassa]|eukprot:XP_011393343.1 hypothetical protein NCU16334 [Neurospora crassa OR74A]